jgi:hypothetical protein
VVNLFAFCTDDCDQLDRLFRRSALYRPEKWGRRADYRDRIIKYAFGNRTESYRPASRSHIAGATRDDGKTEATKPPLRSVCFNEIPDPGPRKYLLEGLIPVGYATLLHGGGGTAMRRRL